MSATRIICTADHLVIEPIGLDKVWSFTRRITVPWKHVRGATFDPGLKDEPKGLRGPGLRTGTASKLAGVFHQDGARQFWNVSDYSSAVVITLTSEEKFERLIVSVSRPADVVAAINGSAAGL